MKVSLNELRDKIHENAVEHGWWETDRDFGSMLMLMVSELSEALEEYRNNREVTEVYRYCDYCNLKEYKHKLDYCNNCCNKADKPEGIPIELADCIIRILDFCGRYGIDIEEAIRIKYEYNKTRSYRHGGKRV